MSEFPNYRKVIAVCVCAGAGEAVYCDDGAAFYCWPIGDQRRVFVEGTPVPGSQRASELNELAVKAYVPQWEAVARNLAQLLSAVADSLDLTRPLGEGVEPDELRTALARQCAAHGITP
jgi:hypothetical protein